MQRPKSSDVARRAGVSQATVSLVLNNRTEIAIPEATRDRVRRAAKSLGYRPNLLARNLNRGVTQTIGVVMPRLDSSFCGRIAQGIQEKCQLDNYCVLIANTLHQASVEAEQVELLLDHQVDGLIAVVEEGTVGVLEGWLDSVMARQVPCVLVDTRTYAHKVDCVISDDVDGARLVVQHLLGLGHRRIAFRSAGEVTSTARDRLKGYREALKSAGLRMDSRLVIGSSYYPGANEDDYRALLNLSDPPTAVFAVNDEVACEAIRCLRRLGRRVPEDIAVVGYADYAFSEYLQLTTVRQDAVEMGRSAARRLLQRIANPALSFELITLPTRLVRRESCGSQLHSVPFGQHENC